MRVFVSHWDNIRCSIFTVFADFSTSLSPARQTQIYKTPYNPCSSFSSFFFLILFLLLFIFLFLFQSCIFIFLSFSYLLSSSVVSKVNLIKRDNSKEYDVFLWTSWMLQKWNRRNYYNRKWHFTLMFVTFSQENFPSLFIIFFLQANCNQSVIFSLLDAIY